MSAKKCRWGPGQDMKTLHVLSVSWSRSNVNMGRQCGHEEYSSLDITIKVDALNSHHLDSYGIPILDAKHAEQGSACSWQTNFIDR